MHAGKARERGLASWHGPCSLVGVISRRRDGLRIALFLPLLVFALLGRARVAVDVENLAMKAVGTATDQATTLRDREFGDAKRILLLACLRAPETHSHLDDEAIAGWIGGLEARPEVAHLESTTTPHPGERAVVVTLRTDGEGRYAESVPTLEEAARASLPPTFKLAMAGVPVTELAIADAVRHERGQILPLLIGTLALVLLLVYRSPVLVLGTLLAPLIGTLMLEGLQGWLGLELDPISALVPPSVLTVGVASSVHIVERYRRTLAEDATVMEASRHAARELRGPLTLTLVTTLAGFLGLAWSPIPAVRRFGLLASVGVALAIWTTLLILPSYLRLIHRPRRKPRRPHTGAEPRSHARANPWILGSTAVIFVGALLAPRSEEVHTDPLAVLPAAHRVRTDAQVVAKRLGGNEVFELLLPPDPDAQVAAPFRMLGLVNQVTSLPEVVRLAAEPRTSPAGYGLLTFLMASDVGSRRGEVFSEVEALAHASGFPGAAATGLAVRITRDSEELVTAQRRGVLVTLFALWLLMSVGFRSAWLGLLGLVPNVLPLLLIGAALGLLERPMTVASSMIGTVLLGLVVDDTIHLLSSFRAACGTPVERTLAALRDVRRPIIVTTLVLSVGFATTWTGDLIATREFGALAVITLLIALVADLVLLPALLSWRGGERVARTAPEPCA